MNNTLTVCGVNCATECHAFGSECPGCIALAGRVSWAAFLGKTVCPIYTCVQQRGFACCGECPDLPCQIWLVETKNPDRTDEEYAADLQQRLKNLGRVRAGIL